nr:hypothetical protein [Pseudomonas sp. HS-18]
MQTIRDLPFPQGASSQFVEIAAFGHQYITRFESIALNFVAAHLDGLDRAQVEVTVLHIGDSQVGQLNTLKASNVLAKRYPRADLGDLIHSFHNPVRGLLLPAIKQFVK